MSLSDRPLFWLASMVNAFFRSDDSICVCLYKKSQLRYHFISVRFKLLTTSLSRQNFYIVIVHVRNVHMKNIADPKISSSMASSFKASATIFSKANPRMAIFFIFPARVYSLPRAAKALSFGKWRLSPVVSRSSILLFQKWFVVHVIYRGFLRRKSKFATRWPCLRMLSPEFKKT